MKSGSNGHLHGPAEPDHKPPALEAIMTKAEHTEITTDHQLSGRVTRRAALRGTAIGAAAAVLPAGAAIAATGPDVDPGLAQLEAGYARWQGLHAEKHRLRRRASWLQDKADAAVRPLLPPEPPIPPELEPYSGVYGVHWGTVPRRGKVAKIAKVYGQADRDWRKKRNDLLDDQPDFQRSEALDAPANELDREADALRHELLAIPTRSARGLLIKLTLTTDSPRIEDLDKRFARPGYYGTFDASEDLMRPLLADLRAMVAGGVA